jgi:hypothetical protein
MERTVVLLMSDGISYTRAPAGVFLIDPDGSGYIHPEHIVRAEPRGETHYRGGQFHNVTLDLSDEAEELLAAYNRGERLCYDADPEAKFPTPDNYGGPVAELFWAVTYRGGLGLAPKATEADIRTVADFQAAERCDGDGYASTDGDYINDQGTIQNVECYAEEPCPECGDGCVFGAGFPNGDADGVCLNCGAELIWADAAGAWERDE